MITHLTTSHPGIKDTFEKLFKAETWRAHGESGTHLLSHLFINGRIDHRILSWSAVIQRCM